MTEETISSAAGFKASPEPSTLTMAGIGLLARAGLTAGESADLGGSGEGSERADLIESLGPRDERDGASLGIIGHI